MNVTDTHRQTDGHTLHDGIGRECKASLSKNATKNYYSAKANLVITDNIYATLLAFKAVAAFFHSGAKLLQCPHLKNSYITSSLLTDNMYLYKLFYFRYTPSNRQFLHVD